MALIDERVAAQVREELQGLEQPVRLAVAFQSLADPESEEVRRLVEELCGLDPRLRYEPVNFVLDQARVAALGFKRTPAIAVLQEPVEGQERDFGLRLYGLPSGYEFGSLIEAVLDVSSGRPQLQPATVEALRGLPSPVHLQVFSTPT